MTLTSKNMFKFIEECFVHTYSVGIPILSFNNPNSIVRKRKYITYNEVCFS